MERTPMWHTPIHLWRRAWTVLLSTRSGAGFIRYVAQPIDRLLLPLSRGRVTLSSLIYPTLMLTTVGAKSGQPRQVPLIFFVDDGRIILVASNFGGASQPAWYHNLRANPQATVLFAGRERTYRAREAGGIEYAELWRRAVAYYAGFAAYQQRTGGRQIPIMVLEQAP